MTHNHTTNEYRPTFAALHTANMMALMGPATDFVLACTLRRQAMGDISTAVAMVALPRLLAGMTTHDEV